jgi:hypothetical protein
VTDETDRDQRRRRTRIAVAGSTLALGLGALGGVAAAAFADGGGSSASDSTGATMFVQSETTPERQAPDWGDCPGERSQEGEGSQGSSTDPS